MTDLEMLKKWIKDVEKKKKEIEKLETKDRLALTASITQLHNSIIASLHGWAAWLRNPPVINNLSEKDLRETFEIFRKLAIQFLDLDLRMSTKVLQKQEKKPRKKLRKEKKATYVS